MKNDLAILVMAALLSVGAVGMRTQQSLMLDRVAL
jgi:hypothetical protein